MRVLRIHNRYQERGGEDVSFDAECLLLESRGHDVHRVLFDNSEIKDRSGLRDKYALAVRTTWSRPAVARIEREIKDFNPDVAHFDNTFPLVSPGAYSVCRRAGVPVVQSLRNYRLLCPAATFFRDGHICEDCLRKTPPYPGVIRGCYHGSHVQSAVVAGMLTFHRFAGTWQKNVDLFMTLTEFSKSKFVDNGFVPDQIVVKPNFVAIPGSLSRDQGRGFLFVGRLSREKGVLTLLRALEETRIGSIDIVGDGPLRADVDAFAVRNPAATIHGALPTQETYCLMHSTQALIFPSEWYETFGRVAIEAFAHGTPVIASKIGAIAELVQDRVNGLLFEPGNASDLADKIAWAAAHPAEMRQMGENARAEYEAKYTPGRNYAMLMDIYLQVIELSRARRGSA